MASLRGILQISSAVIVVIGLILNLVAVLTPSWQVAYARELEQWIKSGLFVSCNTRPAGMYTCTYMFTDNDFDFYNSAEMINYRTPTFYAWQRIVFRIIMAGQFFALIALILFCVAQMGKARKCANVFLCILLGFAALLSLIGSLTFAIHSQMVEYRFFHVSVSGIYERQRGYSFYVQLIGALFHLFAFILATCATIYIFRKDDDTKARQQQRIILQQQSPYQSSILDPRDEYFAMRKLPDLPKK